MVDERELREIARNAVHELLQYYRKGRLGEYLDNVLGIRVCEDLVGMERELSSATFTVTVGGPNVYVRFSPLPSGPL